MTEALRPIFSPVPSDLEVLLGNYDNAILARYAAQANLQAAAEAAKATNTAIANAKPSRESALRNEINTAKTTNETTRKETDKQTEKEYKDNDNALWNNFIVGNIEAETQYLGSHTQTEKEFSNTNQVVFDTIMNGLFGPIQEFSDRAREAENEFLEKEFIRGFASEISRAYEGGNVFYTYVFLADYIAREQELIQYSIEHAYSWDNFWDMVTLGTSDMRETREQNIKAMTESKLAVENSVEELRQELLKNPAIIDILVKNGFYFFSPERSPNTNTRSDIKEVINDKDLFLNTLAQNMYNKSGYYLEGRGLQPANGPIDFVCSLGAVAFIKSSGFIFAKTLASERAIAVTTVSKVTVPRNLAVSVDATTSMTVEQILLKQGVSLSDDLLVNFRKSVYDKIKPSVSGGHSYWFRYGDIKHMTPEHLKGAIGTMASSGLKNGTNVMHVYKHVHVPFIKTKPTSGFGLDEWITRCNGVLVDHYILIIPK